MIRPKSWTSGTFYILGDNLPYNHPAKEKIKGMNYFKSIGYAPTPSNGYCVRAKWTGEYRNPKKGEYYLSGCEGYERAYLAPNDFSDKFFIMKVVLIKTKTIQKFIEIEEY